ncbi:MAG: hypothetical protein K2Q03_07580 [Sphingobacteriaceae bacterium]|nr:hypothetical protein [Sphingobacteriaceae bacterium]
MKKVIKTMSLSFGLLTMGSIANAQSLADANKAIDAEQFHKAKTMLKQLVTNQPKKGDNYFHLGRVYLLTDNLDSAVVTFNNGLLADPKNELNYVGLGQASLHKNDHSAAKSNFDKAMERGNKSYKTNLYIGKAYLSVAKPEDPKAPKADFNTALTYLKKADSLEVKDLDAEVFIALGDCFALQSKNSEAYTPYNTAKGIDGTLARPDVQIGRMFKQARNWVDAERQLKSAIELDANYGPAYRELAELYLQWASFKPTDPKMALALTNYKKYIDLTDYSFESKLRYAQFLIYAQDFKGLTASLNDLNAGKVPEEKKMFISRFKGYSEYENGNYNESLNSLNSLFSQSNEKSKIFASDYKYLGRAQFKTGADSLAVLTFKKGAAIDSTLTDEMSDVAKKLAKDKKYAQAADAFRFMIAKNPKSPSTATNYFFLGQYNFYNHMFLDKAVKELNKGLLVEADSAMSYVNRVSPEFIGAYSLRAKINNAMDTTSPQVGLANPYYEKFIELATATPEKATANAKALASAYDSLGYFYMDTDKEKAKDYFNKSLAINPVNDFATKNLQFLNGPVAPAAPSAPKKPIKK